MMRGSCLCGAVGYEVSGPLTEMHHCHCGNCRKSHGAAFATYAQVSRDDFRFTRGQERVRTFRSSPPCGRTFCSACGANLQFLLESVPDSLWIAVASLDDLPGERPMAHIYVGSKAPWHDITDGLPRFAELPPTG
jgi:hypothetical protein